MTKYSPDKGRGGWRVSKHEKNMADGSLAEALAGSRAGQWLVHRLRRTWGVASSWAVACLGRGWFVARAWGTAGSWAGSWARLDHLLNHFLNHLFGGTQMITIIF